jgi:hypothetical protein
LASNLVGVRSSDDRVAHPVHHGGQSFQFCDRFIDRRRGEAPKKVRACPKRDLLMSHNIIVKQYGGTIDVDTAPGAFTEFRIVLPRAGASLIKSGEHP